MSFRLAATSRSQGAAWSPISPSHEMRRRPAPAPFRLGFGHDSAAMTSLVLSEDAVDLRDFVLGRKPRRRMVGPGGRSCLLPRCTRNCATQRWTLPDSVAAGAVRGCRGCAGRGIAILTNTHSSGSTRAVLLLRGPAPHGPLARADGRGHVAVAAAPAHVGSPGARGAPRSSRAGAAVLRHVPDPSRMVGVDRCIRASTSSRR